MKTEQQIEKKIDRLIDRFYSFMYPTTGYQRRIKNKKTKMPSLIAAANALRWVLDKPPIFHDDLFPNEARA